MKAIMLLYNVLVVLICLTAGCTRTYYVVRHADRPASGADALISPDGYTRAKVLADTLRNKGIKHIFVTPFNRTRLTATPLSETISIPLTEYSPTPLSAFVNDLKKKKTSLVVGHSDTVLQTVSLLGASPTATVILAREFDRLFIVTRKKVFLMPLSVSLTEARYGAVAH